MFALTTIIVALAIIFIYDRWKTWRRETEWRREAKRQNDAADRS